MKNSNPKLPKLHKPYKISVFGAILLFSLTLHMGACKEKKNTFQKSNKDKATVVDVIIAQKNLVSDFVEVNGTVVANEFVELKPEVNGLLTYVNIPEGQVVKKGTVIAKINNADLLAQLDKIKIQLALAEKTDLRLKKLIDINGVNQADYDQNLSVLNGFKADLQYTQTLIDKTIIRAPFTGTVGLRRVSEGAVVTTATILATIQQLSQLRVDFTVPEVYQKYIHKGSSVEVHLADDQTSRTAKIIATEPAIDLNTRNLTVRAVLNGGLANPGAFAKININVSKDKSVILVPTNCIIPEAKSKKIVTVENGVAKYNTVETGDRQENNIEVISGLYVGDSVVVSGVLFTRPNAAVKVRSVKQLVREEQSKQTPASI